MATETSKKGMNAELCRLLSHAPSTAYYQQNVRDLPYLLDVADELSDLSVGTIQEWLIEQALEAYSIDNLNPVIRGFLKDCDRVWQLTTELQSKESGVSYTTLQQRALEIFEAEQTVEPDSDNEDGNEDDEEDEQGEEE